MSTVEFQASRPLVVDYMIEQLESHPAWSPDASEEQIKDSLEGQNPNSFVITRGKDECSFRVYFVAPNSSVLLKEFSLDPDKIKWVFANEWMHYAKDLQWLIENKVMHYCRYDVHKAHAVHCSRIRPVSSGFERPRRAFHIRNPLNSGQD